MRLSVERDDVGFYPHAHDLRRVSVTVDGDEIKDVVTADEEAGFVLTRARNEAGHMFVDPERPDRAATKEVRGVVVINAPAKVRRAMATPVVAKLTRKAAAKRAAKRKAQGKARAATRKAAK